MIIKKIFLSFTFENVGYNISSAPRLSSKIRKPRVFSANIYIYVIVSNLLLKTSFLSLERND